MSNLHRLIVSYLTDSYSLNLETKSFVYQDIVLTSLTLPYRLFLKKGGGGVFVICSERNELKKNPEFVSLLQVLYHVHKFLFYEVYE